MKGINDLPIVRSTLVADDSLLQASAALGGILPDRDVERVLSIRPQSAVHRLDLGHMMHMENPEPIVPVVQAFLDSLTL